MTISAVLSRCLIFTAVALFRQVPVALAQECDSNGVCDKHERCRAWQEEGECFRNKQYMDKYCPIACKGEPQKLSDLSGAKAGAKAGTATKDECKDFHPRCPVWKSMGECEENPADMKRYCRKSCNACSVKSDVDESSLCLDKHELCAYWASLGECKANPNFMAKSCAKSCNTCEFTGTRTLEQESTADTPADTGGDDDDVVDDVKKSLLDWSEVVGVRQSAVGTEASKTLQKIQASKFYWESEATKALPQDLRDKCRNLHELCAFWALLGECEKNKAYMTTNCGPSCNTCHLIDIKARCPPLEDPRPALRPGGLNKMFERIVRTAPGNNTEDNWTEEVRKNMYENKAPPYTVTVHSRPSEEPATDVDPVIDKSLPPWLITFDNFMTAEECQEMIDLGYKYEYKRSEDVGNQKPDGTYGSIQSARRTSENSWCSGHAGCRDEELPARMHKRIAEVLQIPPENSEDFQILRYELNQFYKTHHDYIPHQKDRQCGPRILTFFMYLSDVEKGGGTNFPQLNITVEPKRGRAVLWPSVFDSDPMKIDSRFYHQALPVEEGTKFAFNGWIHMYDYITPQSKGCN